VRVNVEADSLNGAILGPDAEPGSDTYSLFLRDVVRDMTQKAGQKCTAIRRVFVPEAHLDAGQEDLVDRLQASRGRRPPRDDVTVGPVATAAQLLDVRAGIARLASESTFLLGARGPFDARGVAGQGLLRPAHALREPRRGERRTRSTSTRCSARRDAPPLRGTRPRSWPCWARGGGGLVCSVYSDDRAFTADVLFGIAPFHGRVVLGSEKIADQAPGPGAVLPQTIHGGPGRAGGGEELGGARGLGILPAAHRRAGLAPDPRSHPRPEEVARNVSSLSHPRGRRSRAARCGSQRRATPFQRPSDRVALVGRTLAGRFRLTGFIGEGAMAVVYRGEQDEAPKDVAVKVMHPHLARSSRS
jgi:hypothetical protein